MTLLLEACNKLARLEFERVGALRDMKRNMAIRRNALHKMIVQVQFCLDFQVFIHNIRKLVSPYSSLDLPAEHERVGDALSCLCSS